MIRLFGKVDGAVVPVSAWRAPPALIVTEATVPKGFVALERC